MGIDVDNFSGGAHVSGGAVVGYHLNLHRGNQNIDTWSPDTTQKNWRILQSIAQSGTLADLDSAGAAIWPGWWPQFVHAREGGLAAVRLLLVSQ